MSQKYALVGAWWFRGSEQSLWLRIGGGSWVECTMNESGLFPAAGFYAYPTGDGNDDDALYVLTQNLNATISAYPSVTLGFLDTTIDDDTGIISFKWYDLDTAGALEIAFDHPTDPDNNNNTYFLHDLLRMTATPTSTITVPSANPGTKAGDRAHGYTLRPIRYMMTDLEDYEARVSQAVPDTGMVQTLRTSMRRRRRIGIRTDLAYPRAAVFNEYHQLTDFMEHASTGRPFRLYPDRSTLGGGSAYAEGTNPWGYSTLVLDKDSASWRPEPAQGNWYKVMDTSLLAWEV
jgi:hypothetical protein